MQPRPCLPGGANPWRHEDRPNPISRSIASQCLRAASGHSGLEVRKMPVRLSESGNNSVLQSISMLHHAAAACAGVSTWQRGLGGISQLRDIFRGLCSLDLVCQGVQTLGVNPMFEKRDSRNHEQTFALFLLAIPCRTIDGVRLPQFSSGSIRLLQ